MRYLLLIILLIIGVMTWAQTVTPDQQYSFLVGQSDVIVLATVTDAPIPPLPVIPADAIALPRGNQVDVSLKIQKVLKGDLQEVTVTVTVALQPAIEVEAGGSIAITGWTPNIKVGADYVVGLCREAVGYRLCGGAMGGIVPGAETAAVTTAIAAFPMALTLTPPTGPIVIGALSTWTFTVKNMGKEPFDLGGASLQAYQSSTDFDDGVTFQWGGDDSGLAPTRTVKPGEEAKVSVTMQTNGPSNWRLFDPKVYPLPTMIQGIMSVRMTDGQNRSQTVTSRTVWTQVLVERPPAP